MHFDAYEKFELRDIILMVFKCVKKEESSSKFPEDPEE
jgi:hypothetical protein